MSRISKSTVLVGNFTDRGSRLIPSSPSVPDLLPSQGHRIPSSPTRGPSKLKQPLKNKRKETSSRSRSTTNGCSATARRDETFVHCTALVSESTLFTTTSCTEWTSGCWFRSIMLTTVRLNTFWLSISCLVGLTFVNLKSSLSKN